MQKFYVCKHCGNLVGMVEDAGVPLICCGQPMQELTANTAEAAFEKHLPVITVDQDVVTVQIGSVEHPMAAEHHIAWIYLETEKGGQRKALQVGDAPIAKFVLCEDTLVAAYAYCNLHGLWKTEA